MISSSLVEIFLKILNSNQSLPYFVVFLIMKSENFCILGKERLAKAEAWRLICAWIHVRANFFNVLITSDSVKAHWGSPHNKLNNNIICSLYFKFMEDEFIKFIVCTLWFYYCLTVDNNWSIVAIRSKERITLSSSALN